MSDDSYEAFGTVKRRNRRQRGGRRRRRRIERRKREALGPPTPAISTQERDFATDLNEEHPNLLAHAIRAAGISPIALLVGALALDPLYGDLAPHWSRSILDKQVAVLTLCAGHAGIIGIWINVKTGVTWSGFAFFVAATATALAGYIAIGGSIAGHIITISLFLLTFLAVRAEWLSERAQSIWQFMRSKKGIGLFLIFLSITMFLVALEMIEYYQAKYENYVRDWILFPMAILVGSVLSVVAMWMVLTRLDRLLPVILSRSRSFVTTVLVRSDKAIRKAHQVVRTHL